MQAQSKLADIIRRAEKADFLKSLVDKHALTMDGKEWLTAALDPFHDYEHQIAGYPDADVSQTTVSCYQYEVNIAQPAGMGGVGNWDCHVYSTPVASSHTLGKVVNEAANWGTLTEPNPVVTASIGPIMIWAAPTGQALGPEIPAAAIKTQLPVPAGGVEDISSGCSRVIAAGFEVHNTTAEVNKQGTVTTYRMPQSSAPFQSVMQDGQNGTLTGLRWRRPPTTVAEANLLKGTRTWAAKDGVYATLMQHTVHNPLLMMSTSVQLFEQYADPGIASVAHLTPYAGVGVTTPKPFSIEATKAMPFDTTGAMFTGLSAATTLTLKVRFYVERAPTFQEPQLAVLASPSAGYDINALQLYAQVINMLPPAVTVGENAKGDWWRAIVSVLKHAAAPIGALANPFLPGAGLLGAAVQAAAGQIDTSKPVAPQVTQANMRQRPRTQPAPARGRRRGRQQRLALPAP